MRILLVGVAAIALSGCSWMNMGYGPQSQSQYQDNHYQPKPVAQNQNGCCQLSRWNVEAASIGPDFLVGGKAITGTRSRAGVAPTTTLRDVSMNDAYGKEYRAELGGSYALNPNRKLTLQGYYAHADGNEVSWGNQGAAILRGTLSDYNAYGIEAGVRQYFKPAPVPLIRSVRPYIEAKAGGAFLDAIRMENINEVGVANAGTPTNLAFYESGWVPSGAGLIGFETPVFNRFTLALESGIRYMGKPKTDRADVGTAGFNSRYSSSNNGGDRWSVPLTLRGRYRF